MDKKYEQYAVVLDMVPSYSSGNNKEKLQLIGTKYFTLLEAKPLDMARYKSQERIYIGKGDRREIDTIIGRINYEDLTSVSKSELKPAIEKIVTVKEEQFLEFINESSAITSRSHQLSLIPRIGEKIMKEILDKRPFSSYDEVMEQIPAIPDPSTLFVNRIEKEIKEDTRYNLFTRG